MHFLHLPPEKGCEFFYSLDEKFIQAKEIEQPCVKE